MPGEKFCIRQASQKDAELISEMGARTFRDSFGPDNTPDDMEAYLAVSFSLPQIETELADPASTFLLAYGNDLPIGYLKLKEGPAPEVVSGPKPVELVRIYIEKNQIGSGYGSALMKACIEFAERSGHRTIWLGVWQKNERAIRFYQKWGFEKVGTQIFLLGADVQDDFVMAKPINRGE